MKVCIGRRSVFYLEHIYVLNHQGVFGSLYLSFDFCVGPYRGKLTKPLGCPEIFGASVKGI